VDTDPRRGFGAPSASVDIGSENDVDTDPRRGFGAQHRSATPVSGAEPGSAHNAPAPADPSDPLDTDPMDIGSENDAGRMPALPGYTAPSTDPANLGSETNVDANQRRGALHAPAPADTSAPLDTDPADIGSETNVDTDPRRGALHAPA
jgi:hypothetical protein